MFAATPEEALLVSSHLLKVSTETRLKVWTGLVSDGNPTFASPVAGAPRSLPRGL